MCRQDGGKYLIFYSSGDQEWLNTEFSAGNTTSGLYHVSHVSHVYVYHVYHVFSGLANEVSSYCPDSDHR